jgi:hypothetical protein
MHIQMKADQSLGEAILDGIARVAAMKPTFCGKWMSKVRKAIAAEGSENGESHYTARGCVSYFTDTNDGQRYRVTIEPVKAAAE